MGHPEIIGFDAAAQWYETLEPLESVPCLVCDGTGLNLDSDDPEAECKVCGGTGEKVEDEDET